MRSDSLSTWAVALLPLCAGVMVIALALAPLRAAGLTSPSHENSEVLYLPDGNALEVVSLGYRNVLANVLWFNTISYFGKHFRGDRDYRWLSHMCEIVTDLDPGAEHVYRFGATMLSWEAKNVEGSNRLLDKAIAHSPNNWLYYYLRGFNFMFFLKDTERARNDFVRAAELPGVHHAVVTLAAKKLSELNSPSVAVEFLEEILRTTEDPMARRALEERLFELKGGLHP